MHGFRNTAALLAGLACAFGATLADAQERARPFAAPDSAASLPATQGGGIGQATLALLLVLAAIFVIAWLARRLRGLRGGTGQGIDVLAQAAVGPRERVVIVRVGGVRLVLGVAPGSVARLHELPPDAELDAAAKPLAAGLAPGFADTLRGLLGRGQPK